MRLFLSALAMVCTMAQASGATSLPPQKKLMELKQTQVKQKDTKQVQPKQIQPKQIKAKPPQAAKKLFNQPRNQVRNQNLDLFSSSSSSASESIDDQAHIGAYTNNLGLDVEFDPSTLDPSLVLADIPDSDPVAQAMIFDTNEPGSPVNITHPTVGPDYTRFRIDKNGTYLITWTFTIGCLSGQGEGCLNGAFVQLYDVAHEQPLFPNPMQFIDTEVLNLSPGFYDSETVSGQQVISLEAVAELQLRLIHAEFDFGTIWVANPSLTITRIGS